MSCSGPSAQFMPLTVAFATDSVPMHGRTPEERCLGGSESAMVFMARALVARGHQVDVFTRCDCPGDYDGVTYHDLASLPDASLARDWDVFVALRFPHVLMGELRAGLKILWCQDLLSIRAPDLPLARWITRLDRLMFVSAWHLRDTARAFPGIEPFSWVTRNPIWPELIPEPVDKADPPCIVHLSRPERGLEPLLAIWPSLRRRCPGMRLEVARYQSYYEPRGSQIEAFCLAMDQRVRETDGAAHLGNLSKPQLYDRIARAALMVYPADFDETCCIAAIEAQACGTPIVAARRAALAETIHPEAGRLVDGQPRDGQFLDRFADAVVELMHDSGLRERMARAGREHARSYDAAVLAADWETQWRAFFEERASSHAGAIAATLASRGDEAAGDVGEEDLRPSCAVAWPGLRPPLASALVAPLGGSHTPVILAPPGSEADVAAVVQMLGRACRTFQPAEAPADLPGDIDGLLDLGCLLQVEDRRSWLETLARSLPPGTPIVHLLPSGHRDDASPGASGRRIDPTYADVSAWFGEVGAAHTLTVEAHDTGSRPLRCWVVSYRAGDLPFGKDDPSRKRWITRPHPSISVCMIVRDEEHHVLRALHSVQPIADEIRIVDTGSLDATVEVIQGFAGRSPIPVHLERIEWPDDFAAARNRSIEGARGDWVLWIDADEELIGAEHLRRYAQSFHYRSYAIRQHNLIFDRGLTQVEVPQRMFRRDTGARFFGCIHEHPELALNRTIEPWLVLDDVHILHTGYLTESGRLRKCLRRNLALLMRDFERYPGRRLTPVLYLRDCVNLASMDLREQGVLSVPTRRALEWALRDFEMRLIPAADRYYHLGREYYDRGLDLLGQGVGVTIRLESGGGRGQPVVRTHHIRDPADLGRVLASAGHRFLAQMHDVPARSETSREQGS